MTGMASKQATTKTQEIRVAHSPDSDDAFMFYALATHKVRVPGMSFQHVLCDIETLNQAARNEIYDVTALSFHAYGFVKDKYVLLDCGASFGEGYGPIVVASQALKPAQLKGRRIGIPGPLTTAFLAMQLYEPEFTPVQMAFDKILDAVKQGIVDAGLLIHEGQLMYSQMGFHKVVDLGQWWLEQTGLPLPLGGNGVRKALGQETGRIIARAIRDSVQYALEHREEALNYAMQFARDMDPDLADKFVGMYVNKWTLGYGERGRAAIRELLDRGARAGVMPKVGAIEFLDEES